MNRYEMVVPEGWYKHEERSYPGKGSKLYKSENTDANISVVNMYNTGRYTVIGEDQHGEWIDEKVDGYFNALETARGWMLTHE